MPSPLFYARAKSTPFMYLTPAAAAAILLLSWTAAPLAAHEPAAAEAAAEMARAGERFLASLDEEQRAKAAFEFQSDRRDFWHYFPSAMLESKGGRPGLPLKEMAPEQRVLAHGLINTALSHRGYLQAMTIVALQAVLHELEDGNPARDPGMFHVAVFGKPSAESTWGWSFEGHHLSINVTLVEGRRFSVTPSFFGANPARVQAGPLEGVEALPVEQNLARELVRSLSREQRKLAMIAEKAPADVVTRADPAVSKDRFQPPEGIPFSKLTAAQQRMLRRLVAEFAERYRPAIVHQIDDRAPIVPGRETFFAWAGGLEPGEPHYWRVQTPDFLFEYDNTQDDANHIHTVWRQFDGDFGEDLLRRHYETSSHHHR